MEGNTIAVLPHRCSVTQGVLGTEAVIVPALEANNIPLPVNMMKETDWIPEHGSAPVAQNLIQSFRRNIICSQTAYILSHAPSRDLNTTEFLLINNNNTS